MSNFTLCNILYHRQNFVHRDIKLENVMIKSIDPMKIQLIDFGFAEALNEEKLISG